MSVTWQHKDWIEQAHAWIDLQLAVLEITRTGAIEQPHIRPWSTVMRVPTSTGPVWFKANMPKLRHESETTALVSGRCPDIVPPLLARDPGTGWMLMSDAGEQLRTIIQRERSVDRWCDVLARYAALQIKMMPDVDALVAAGVPDMRFTWVVEGVASLLGEQPDVEQRFRAVVPYAEELCEQLATYAIPDTVQHDDLHDGQVFVKDDRYLVMDWGDACVSHPFFTLAVTLEGQIEWGVDDVEHAVDLVPFRNAYLAPFRERFDADLDQALDIALRLGWISRAVNGHVPGDKDDWRPRLSMCLEGVP